MGRYIGKTIAFSHKGGFWKTRYSYAPTCYATVDNVMISNNKASGLLSAQNIFFWEHGVNSSHNNFYGEHFESSITVVSNQDPLSVKLFKALSLESDSSDWVGTASTNINPIGAPQNELQSGNIKGFVTKEGNQYTELPRDLVNSSSHIDYVCQLNAIGEQTSLPDAYADGTYIYWFWNTKPATVPNASILGGVNSMAVFANASGEAYILEALYYDANGVNYNDPNGVPFGSGLGWRFVPFAGYRSSSSRIVYIDRYESNGDIILKHRGIGSGGVNQWGGHNFLHFDEDGNPTPDSYEFMEKIEAVQEFTGGDWSTIQLYSASPPEINGDPMRGDFLHLTLTNNSAEPVETYAINVDFENTTLDSSSKGIAS